MAIRTTNRTGAGDLSGAMADLKFTAIWNGFWLEPWSFKLTCFYVFLEYVRPQQAYSWLHGPPWTLICVSAAMAAFLFEGFRIQSKGILNWLILAFSAVVLLSSILASYPETSFSRLNNYASWVVAFVLIANSATTERRWFLFVTLFLLWNAKMSQHGFRSFLSNSWGNGGAPTWFQNSGEFALEMSLLVPLSIHFILGLGKRLSRTQVVLLAFLPVSAIFSIVAAGSRGGQLALVCVGIWMLLRSRYKTRGLVLLAVIAPVIWLSIPTSQKSRFRASGSDATSLARLEYWKAGRDMANKHPFLGVGHENWVPYFRDNYASQSNMVERVNVRGERVIEVSHNIFIEVVSQLGYSGLAIFFALLVGIWYVNASTRRLLSRLGERGRFMYEMSRGLDAGVVAFCVAGFFMAVAFYPFLWFQLAMTAGLHAASTRVASTSGVGTCPQARLGTLSKPLLSSRRSGERPIHPRFTRSGGEGNPRLRTL